MSASKRLRTGPSGPTARSGCDSSFCACVEPLFFVSATVSLLLIDAMGSPREIALMGTCGNVTLLDQGCQAISVNRIAQMFRRLQKHRRALLAQHAVRNRDMGGNLGMILVARRNFPLGALGWGLGLSLSGMFAPRSFFLGKRGRDGWRGLESIQSVERGRRAPSACYCSAASRPSYLSGCTLIGSN